MHSGRVSYWVEDNIKCNNDICLMMWVEVEVNMVKFKEKMTSDKDAL